MPPGNRGPRREPERIRPMPRVRRARPRVRRPRRRLFPRPGTSTRGRGRDRPHRRAAAQQSAQSGDSVAGERPFRRSVPDRADRGPGGRRRLGDAAGHAQEPRPARTEPPPEQHRLRLRDQHGLRHRGPPRAQRRLPEQQTDVGSGARFLPSRDFPRSRSEPTSQTACARSSAHRTRRTPSGTAHPQTARRVQTLNAKEIDATDEQQRRSRRQHPRHGQQPRGQEPQRRRHPESAVGETLAPALAERGGRSHTDPRERTMTPRTGIRPRRAPRSPSRAGASAPQARSASPAPGGTGGGQARHALAAAVALAAATALAACSGTAEPPRAEPPRNDLPPAPAATTYTGPLPGPGVPSVPHPLDTARFKQNPCATLTPAQISGLLGPSPRVQADPQGPVGPACGWFAQASVAVLYPDINDLGLTSVYRAKGGAYPFFLPLAPVDGYPVVAYGEDDPRAGRGECDVAMGTSDRETLVVSITQSAVHKGEKDPCQSARDIAALALGNLRH
ncbi:DUF3558 family protein [Amycolatopsis sp. AA4]|uniref:DUF3558 family protein n=2 Tax=Actinomycetes TaxID=1760 RepID=UPI003518C7A0